MNKKTFKRTLSLVLALAMTLLLSASIFAAEADISGKDVFEKEELTKQQRLKGTIYFQNLNYAAACDGVLTVINKNDKTIMPTSVAGKLYVPLRFILEYYGAEVSWEHETKTVVISAGKNVFRLSTKDSSLWYGDRSKSLDNSCFINKGTTFVAFEDVSDIIVCDTYYYEEYNAGVIAMGEKWDPERQAEKEAVSAMEFALSPFFKMFI